MTPKEKAEELVDDMHYQICSDNGLSESDTTKLCAKQCALIAVAFAKENPLNTDGYNKYLEEVKQEIEKI